MSSPPTVRDDFQAAAARCRARVWRAGLAATLCSAVLVAALALLFTPLVLVLLLLLTDLVNLVVPVPHAIRLSVALADLPRDRSDAAWLAAALAPAYGATVLLFGLAGWRFGRALAETPLFSAADAPDGIGVPGARRPDPDVLAEQRLRNTVEEMALAAGLPAPRVWLVDGGANAAIAGLDAQRTVVLAGTGLAGLSRDELQGVAAHLLASAANGDLGVAREVTRLTMLVSLFLGAGRIFERGGPSRAARLTTALLWPTRARCRDLIDQLTDANRTPAPTPGGRLSWRDWLAMPLAGPVALAGVLGLLLRDFLVLPTIALAWRDRKAMADATAVRLTRYPDALAGALHTMSRAPDTRVPAWLAHLTVVEGLPVPVADALTTVRAAEARAEGLVHGGFVSMFPSVDRRLEALVRLGATDRTPAAAGRSATDVPWLGWMLAVPLLALVVVLLPVAAGLLACASLAVSGVFTLLPGFLLHLALRALA